MIESITSGCTAGLSSPTSKVPPASSRPSSSWVAIGATMPGSRTGAGSVTSRCPLTRSDGSRSGRPSSTGGSPVAKTTAPGWISPADVPTDVIRSPRAVTAGGRHAGGYRRQASGQPGDRAQRVQPGLAPDQRALHRPGQAGDEVLDLAGTQPLDGRRLMRGEPARVRGQADPVELDQADAARHRILEIPPALQAGPLQVHERLGIAPLVRLRDQQPGRAAGRAGPDGPSRSAAPSRDPPDGRPPRWRRQGSRRRQPGRQAAGRQ